MVFSSFHFLFFFLPALLLCYFLIPQKLRAGRNLLLLAFSLFFYAYGGVRFLPLMLVSIGINYLFGLLCAPGLRGRRLFLSGWGQLVTWRCWAGSSMLALPPETFVCWALSWPSRR